MSLLPRREDMYWADATAPDGFVLDGMRYDGQAVANGAKVAEGDKVLVARTTHGLTPGRRRGMVILQSSSGATRRARSRPYFNLSTITFGVWSVPEGMARISYGLAATAQTLPDPEWPGTDDISEAISRLTGGGFDFASQIDKADPTGLVRYDVGSDHFLLLYYWESGGTDQGAPRLSLYNLGTSGFDVTAERVQDSGTPRNVSVWERFRSERRQGYLFHLVDPAAALDPLLVIVAHGNSAMGAGDGGGFWVRRHQQLGLGNTSYSKWQAWTADAILDRASGTDFFSGKYYKPIERSGGIAAADMCAFECYWTGWAHIDNPDKFDDDHAAEERSRLHSYRLAVTPAEGETPAAVTVTASTSNLQTFAADSLAVPIWEILACGIFDRNTVEYDVEGSPELREQGSQLQILSTRWPYSATDRAFWIQVSVQARVASLTVPRILTAKLKCTDSSLTLINARQPDNTLQFPYSTWLTEQVAALEATIPEYLDYAHGGSYTSQFRGSGTPRKIYDFELEACVDDLQIDPETGEPIEPPTPIQYQISVLIGTVPEVYFLGLGTAFNSAIASLPAEGLIIPMPLPPDQIYFQTDTWIEDNAGKNYGLIPGGCFDKANNHFQIEIYPKRLVVGLELSTNGDYTGPFPTDGVEETEDYTSANYGDALGSPYAECFVPFTAPSIAHNYTAQEARYSSIQTYYRTRLVYTNSAGVETQIDISCPVTLTSETPRYEGYSIPLNVIAWGCSGQAGSEVLWILRQWPRGHDGTEQEYATVQDVIDLCELHLELRLAADPDTVLGRTSLRPTSDVGSYALLPYLAYAPKFNLGVDSDGFAWCHAWTQWLEDESDTDPVHAFAAVKWTTVIVKDDHVTVAGARPPSGFPHIVEAAVAVAADGRYTWIDDCATLRGRAL